MSEARTISLNAGQELFAEGSLPRALFQVELGCLKLVRSSTGGRDTIGEILCIGDYFDLPSLLDGQPYLMGAFACSPNSARVKRIEREAVLQDPGLIAEAEQQYWHRYRFQRRMMSAVATERVEHRALLALCMLGERCGVRYEHNRLAFPMPLSRQEFGELIGTTTETAIRILSDMRKRGWLKEDQRLMTLCDFEEMRAAIQAA